MYEVSDNIQALAIAFGERFNLEASMANLNATSGNVKTVLTKAIRLHCLF